MKHILKAALLLTAMLLLAACTGAPASPAGEAAETEEPVAPTNTASPTETPVPEPTATPEPTEVPEATATPEPAAALEMLGAPTDADRALEERLDAIVIPISDPVANAIALEGVDPNDIPEPPTEPVEAFEVGDIATFWISNADTNEYLEIEAELITKSRYGYFWLDTGSVAVNATRFPATAQDWKAAADTWDASYEAVRAVFGTEASPGIDGDPILHIVSSDRMGGVGGYFSAPDSLPVIVEPYSNEHEMFFMSIPGTGGIASEYFNKTLAHEFQHMVHANMDGDEESWMNEGLSELAQQIAGLRGDDWVADYISNLDQSLWFWGSEGADYGNAYLVIDYLYERFGADFITALVADSDNGFNSIDAVLAASGEEQTFDQVWADYATAVALNNAAAAPDGRFAFREANVGTAEITEGFRALPAEYTGEVNQYGIDIIRVRGEGPATLTFTGAQTVMVVPVDARSGANAWWSNHRDSMFSTLTREVDLSGVDSATLNFAVWYHIERDWDYGYVMVSTDDGNTWTTLPARTTTDSDPLGNNFGHGFTGRSGGRNPVWIDETVDLSAYAGQTILLRFALVTDEAYSERGMVIDDVAIPEIGWSDDMESGEGDWVADGFVLQHNRIPQPWMLRVALIGRDGRTTIQDLAVVDGTATLDIDYGQVDTAVVLISGLARHSIQMAPYQLSVTAR